MAELLTGLEIAGYRQFERFTMDGLRRVNLLVGKNNSGKTALLEALQILNTRPVLGAIQAILERRGEMEPLPKAYGNAGLRPSIRHLFPKHLLAPGKELSIKASGLPMSVVLIDEGALSDYEMPYFRVLPEIGDEQALSVIEDDERSMAPLTAKGLLIEPYGLHDSEESAFLGTDGISLMAMAQLYDSLFELGGESEVIEALQVLDERIVGIHFRPLKDYARGGAGSNILLDYGEGGRHPLGSAGEGMRRMLGLALALSNAKGGVLLVDEIDTGLHYSVMGDLWRLVVETARRLDVQVFATTHSKDCVEGLEHMRSKSPDLFEDVAVHTIDVRRGRSVVSAGERLEDAVQLGVELR